MNFNDEVKDLVFNINDYSERHIKNIFEVSVLIDSALSLGKKQDFKDLIFSAKYVNGLKNVLSNRSINGDKYIEKIFDEFNKSLQKFFELLKSVVSVSGESNVIHFNKKYFQMNQENVFNGMELVEDLSLCKEYFNNNPSKIFN
ncbi:MAG: hypothetical protein ABI840_01150 [bacterium]